MTPNHQRDKDLKELATLSAAGKRVVFTNGCFDILHVGHVRYLTSAKALGDILVVGLNSDASVHRLKGESRPICNEHDRKELLCALRPVDFAVIFDDDTPLSLIKTIRPNVLAKGGDWTVEKIVGGDFVKSYGGEVISLPFVEGRSTTDIIDRIQRSCSLEPADRRR